MLSCLLRHWNSLRGDAERGDEYVHDGDEEDAQDCHVVDLVRLAALLVVVDVVSAVHDQTDAHQDLRGKIG